MIPRKIEEIVKPVVEKFVAGKLQGRYKDHASDQMLTTLIMYHLGNPSRREPEKCLAHVMVEGDGSAAYEATCWLFESVLEHGCRAGGNGHHVAQSFCEAMSILSEPHH